MSWLRVTDLITYPVKSCAGVHLSESAVTPRGLALDRDFMVIDDTASFVSQRTVPQLALVVPTLGERELTLDAPGMETIAVPYEVPPDDARALVSTVHGREVLGQLVDEALDAWFTRFLPPYRENRRYRLVRVREDAPRLITERYRLTEATNQVGFADGNAMLLATEPSLAELNRELAEPVPMNRFRPNIVVDGADLTPYDEDTWVRATVGAMTVFVVKACDRCAIPDVDQTTGVVGKAVRRGLRVRKGANAHDPGNTGVFFAQNLSHVWAPGLSVAVGDEVRVLERAPEPNVVLTARVAPAASRA